VAFSARLAPPSEARPAAGVYFLRLSQAGAALTRRVVITS
jgi:hypothetical protein